MAVIAHCRAVHARRWMPAVALTMLVALFAFAPRAVAAPVSARASLVVSFRQDAEVRLRGRSFVSLAGDDVSGLNARLAGHPRARATRLFERSEAALDAERDRLIAGRRGIVPDLNRHYRIDVDDQGEREALRAELQALPIVSAVVAEPAPAPPPVTPDLSAAQGYAAAAPGGIDVAATSGMPGGMGQNVKLIDIEYSWNRAHEDLTKAAAPGTLIANGTPWDPFANNQHGTAALGELIADRNGFGVSGLIPGAALRLVNAAEQTCECWAIADAINVARLDAAAGDVILIEQQTPGLGETDYVPVEWYAPAYDAIRTATQAGIIVVEAAGNGGQNLDDPAYGAPFPGGRASSGAIIAGAGTGNCTSPANARMSFSTYGTRVDLQGWGQCVTTTGYGDAYSGGTPNSFYTSSYSGTSSASPMVAAAAATYSSLYQAKHGVAPTPRLVRDRLVATGTRQDASSPGHIGPLPNLKAAALDFDTTPPTVTSRAPAVSATGVAATSPVTATFGEAVTGVSGSTFTLKNAAGAVVAATVGYNATTRVATLAHAAALAGDAKYTATLSAAIKDRAGNPLAPTSWTFTTGPRPTVTAKAPSSGATAVARTANVTATFSEPVAGVSQSTFTLAPLTPTGALGPAVTAVVTRNATTNQWILNPSATLNAQSKYRATLRGGTTAIRDVVGNPLTTATWDFTTGS